MFLKNKLIFKVGCKIFLCSLSRGEREKKPEKLIKKNQNIKKTD
jgi:hypothetical protein